jgi:Uma2 family endonuclease
MSAQDVGKHMPARVRLQELALMAAADDRHRYELSAEGVLSVSPNSPPDHVMLVSRLFAWLISNSFTADQVVANCGIDVGGAGRVPDLTLWAAGRPPSASRSPYAAVDGLLLVVEVVADCSATTDWVVKHREYAAAGIPRYWLVERDHHSTVHQHRLHHGQYTLDRAGTQPFVSLLTSTPPSDAYWGRR